MRVKEGETEYAEGSFSVPLLLDPGMHHLTVKAAGYSERDLDVALEAGETAEISIAPGAALPIEAQPAKAPPEADGRRTLGYVLAGVGATGLVVGVVSGVLVLHQKSVYDENCDVRQKVCNQAGKDAEAAGRALSVVSVVGFATGIAASAAGTYFILTNHSGRALSASGTVAPATAFSRCAKRSERLSRGRGSGRGHGSAGDLRYDGAFCVKSSWSSLVALQPLSRWSPGCP